MKFVSKVQLVLVSVRPVKTKAGKDLTFVKLADPATYENVDFILGDGLNFNGCAAGELVDVCLDVDGRFMSCTRYIPEVPFEMKADKKGA